MTLLIEPTDIPMTISRSQDGLLQLDKPYVRVTEGATVRLIWTLDQNLKNHAHFDNPGITLFGERLPALGWQWSPTEISVVWSNSDEPWRGRSFYYRIYIITEDGVMHHDPVVHNDPPTVGSPMTLTTMSSQTPGTRPVVVRVEVT